MDRPPNFVLFVTDQHRADHLGCYGNPDVRTPHIDAIAAEGCCFDDFHVATPMCQPNRASLLTGRLPSLHGVTMNGRELSHRERGFVEQLRQAGWRTALVGKAHLQNITTTPAAWPAASDVRRAAEAVHPHPGRHGQELWTRWRDDPEFDLERPYYGFEHVQLSIGHADEQWGHWRRWLQTTTPDAERLIGPANAMPTPGLALAASRQAWRTRLPEELHPTRWIADRCCDWLTERARDGQPFFLQCSFPDPHHPFTPPGRWWDLVRPGDLTLPASFNAPLHDPPPPIQALRRAAADGSARKSGHAAFAADEQEVREAIALNHGNLGFIDQAMGQVHAALRRLGIDDNTVLAFTSDHGDLLGDRGLMLKGGLHYRALTRVPFIWRDTPDAQHRPGERAGEGRPRSSRSAALAQTIDIAPTVLERAGIDPPNGMQGRSLLAAARDGQTVQRAGLLIEEEGQRRDLGLGARVRMRTLLTRSHRLTLYAGEPFGELVDLDDDPLELRNLWNDPRSRATRDALAHQLALAMIESAETSPYPGAAA